MKEHTQYERLQPDTANGEALKVTLTYTSFDKAEIDQLEENCKKFIGSGIIQNAKVREVW